MIPFNKKKHSDITVTVSDGAEVDPKEQTFYLHKFPLVSKSHFFDDNIPDSAERPGSIEMHIKEFPGGPSAFESVAQWCYGIDIELTVDDIAPIYCGARFLHIADLEKTTDAFMTEIVLPNPRNAAKVLKVSTEIGEYWPANLGRESAICNRKMSAVLLPAHRMVYGPSPAYSVATIPACNSLGTRMLQSCSLRKLHAWGVAWLSTVHARAPCCGTAKPSPLLLRACSSLCQLGVVCASTLASQRTCATT